MADVIAGIVVVLIVAGIVRYLVKSKQAGKDPFCDGCESQGTCTGVDSCAASEKMLRDVDAALASKQTPVKAQAR